MNPCAAINDLLTFQASPFGLLGTSPKSIAICSSLVKVRRRWDSNPRYLSVSLVFKTSSLNHSDTSTQAIILCRSYQRLDYITTKEYRCQHFFSHFSSFFPTCFFALLIYESLSPQLSQKQQIRIFIRFQEKYKAAIPHNICLQYLPP